MIVVSNTSPLTNLAAIGQFHLLQQLYRQLEIAGAVWDELNAFGQRWPGQPEVSSATWIKQHIVVSNPIISLLERDLDRGEAATIALGISLKADLVLLDEKMGRQIAKRMGLRVVGVLGILLDAKAHKLIPAVRPYLEALRYEASFYVSKAIQEKVLVLAGE